MADLHHAQGKYTYRQCVRHVSLHYVALQLCTQYASSRPGEGPRQHVIYEGIARTSHFRGTCLREVCRGSSDDDFGGPMTLPRAICEIKSAPVSLVSTSQRPPCLSGIARRRIQETDVRIQRLLQAVLHPLHCRSERESAAIGQLEISNQTEKIKVAKHFPESVLSTFGPFRRPFRPSNNLASAPPVHVVCPIVLAPSTTRAVCTLNEFLPDIRAR